MTQIDLSKYPLDVLLRVKKILESDKILGEQYKWTKVEGSAGHSLIFMRKTVIIGKDKRT